MKGIKNDWEQQNIEAIWFFIFSPDPVYLDIWFERMESITKNNCKECHQTGIYKYKGCKDCPYFESYTQKKELEEKMKKVGVI